MSDGMSDEMIRMSLAVVRPPSLVLWRALRTLWPRLSF